MGGERKSRQRARATGWERSRDRGEGGKKRGGVVGREAKQKNKGDDTDGLRLQPRLFDGDGFKRGGGEGRPQIRTASADKTLVLLLSHPIVITYTRGT